MNISLPAISSIAPELILAAWVCGVILIDLFIPKEQKHYVGILSLVGLTLTFLASWSLYLQGETLSLFGGMMALDSLALYFKMVFVVIVMLTIAISLKYLPLEEINLGEYYGMLLFATLGMILMAASTDLITIYLSLELMSLSIYILAGFIKRDPRSIEAALKYFLLGAFSSGILLYGMALVYGLTGSTNLSAIGDYFARHDLANDLTALLAMVLLIAGFAFKIAAVPFHMWAPDVYEGAPTPVTAFMSVGPKAAAFVALMRIFLVAMVAVRPHWDAIFWGLAVLSMTIGNVVAIVQTNLKRMLAYSSIAHAGYVLIGIIAGNQIGYASVLLYMLVYVFMNVGAFSMIILLCTKSGKGDQITDFTGLARSNPWAAAAFVVFFLSLAGIPPTGGFVGKLYIFAAAIQANYVGLAIIGVLNSAISLYYYFRVVMAMYMEEPSGPLALSAHPVLIVALSVMVLATLFLGLYPGPFIDAAMYSMGPLLPKGGFIASHF
ncbi:MAG: NADH-quinone oxidoreductase subunit N [Candidatus Tectomicrobia bacterium]|uniref:NADH-quinone oxidoreductase subunit N n=1 Tax=Tectimicrobiota bacterium TaxID=2528274 RepID=A0A932CQD5_UNCTE|nr:NADH-quinone oxidoreductase subunit N [Candidatus Tectomicrobia bacterium]